MTSDERPSVDTLRVDISYRPLRFGWAIRSDDVAAFRTAVRLSYAFWGGRFNPILLVDREDEAKRLARLFRVDAIWPLGDSDEVKAFPGKFPHLSQHFLRDSFFGEHSGGGKYSNILDVHNTVAHLSGRPEWNAVKSRGIQLCKWDDRDPLSDVLLVQYGGYPDPQSAPDYRGTLVEAFEGTEETLAADAPLPGEVGLRPTIPSLSHFGMERHYGVDARRDTPGFFLGDSSRLDDLVFHWNLRAANIPLLFVDEAHLARYSQLIPAWERLMRELVAPRHEFERHVAVWGRHDVLDGIDRVFPGLGLTGSPASDVLWNGLNITVPMMQFGSASTLGVVSRGGGSPKVSFALSDKPFSGDTWFSTQHLVASVSCGIGMYGDEQHTLTPPYVPEANEFCSRTMHFEPDKLRLEPGRVGLVIDASDTDTFLNALPVGELVERLFALAGYSATPSGAGRIVRQLITRLGGLQGARIFKIPGVRRLLRTYGPTDTFTRQGALQLIGQRDTENPDARFSDHQGLYIEQRSGGDLAPGDVFAFMAERGLFRIGSELTCPSCRLSNWIALDALHQRVACEMCGNEFDATRQLVSSTWHYRRSGILGAERNSQGAIPVALTLQQLGTNLRGLSGETMYSPSLDLTPQPGTGHSKCEVDFVWIDSRPHRNRTAVILGECKDRGPLNAIEFRQAVDNLRKIAVALPKDRFKTFVLVAKLAPFTPKELAIAKTLNDEHHLRAILLTPRELEPYHLYERAPNSNARWQYANSPEDMAWATFDLYFRALGDSAAIGLDA